MENRNVEEAIIDHLEKLKAELLAEKGALAYGWVAMFSSNKLCCIAQSWNSNGYPEGVFVGGALKAPSMNYTQARRVVRTSANGHGESPKIVSRLTAIKAEIEDAEKVLDLIRKSQ